MNQMLIRISGAGAIGVFACCNFLPVAAASALTAAPPAASARGDSAIEFKRVTLLVAGMTCGGCALSARIVLERLQGVQKAAVSYETKLAIVTYDPARITPQQMIEALKQKLRYDAKVVEEEKQP